MENIENISILGKKRRRLHFITNKRKIKIKTSKQQKKSISSPSSKSESSESDSESFTEEKEEIYQSETILTKKPEVIELYSNKKTKEKLLLLIGNLNFTFFGSGNFHVIFGNAEIMGYEADSEKNKSDFDFDLNKNFFLFKCKNTGIYLDKNNINMVKEEYEKIFFSSNNKKNNKKNNNDNNGSFSLVDFTLLNINKYLNRNITLIYFKNISDDFKFLNLNNNFNLTNKKIQQVNNNNNNNHKNNNSTNKTNKGSKSIFSYEQHKQETLLAEERILIETLELIDTKKFAENVDLDANTLKANKKFNIFGKKNSGKSTFLVFFINAFLSSLNRNFRENCKLFLLDCDSGQPLISCPYTVSLLEIKKPLFVNFFRQDLYSKLDLTRKVQLALKENNFSIPGEKLFVNLNSHKNNSNTNPEINNSNTDNNENDDNNLNNKTHIRNLITNLTNTTEQIELIRSIFVDDNSPANNFESYLNAVKHLYGIFNTINNFAVQRLKSELKANSSGGSRHSNFQQKNINFIRENLKSFLIVNTNGYTSGIGNIINSSINELIEPHFVYFVKNLKAGRVQKGEEFENMILNSQVDYDSSVITRKYKLEEEEFNNNNNNGNNGNDFGKGGFGFSVNNCSYQRLEKTTVLIENSFKLKECQNLSKKNFNRVYHLTASFIGDYNFDAAEESKNLSFNSCNSNYNENGINDNKDYNNSRNNYSSLKQLKLYGNNLYDFSLQQKFCENFLTEISFDDLLISFDFSNFEPINELDVLMALNGKMCTLLLNENNVFSKSEKERNSVNKRNLEENYNLIQEIVNARCFGNLTVVDSRNLKDKFFKCFCFVYNIDIINRKFVVFSKQMKEEKNIFDAIKNKDIKKNADKNGNIGKECLNDNSNRKKIEFIIYRNANLDKNLYASVFLKEEKSNKKNENLGSFYFEKMLIDSKFDFNGIKEQDTDAENGFAKGIKRKRDDFILENNEGYYITRNKFSLI